MATYSIPPNTGKVRVAKYLGHKWVVWNGKHGKHEFSLACRNRKQAEEIVAKINVKGRPEEIEVS